MLTWLVENTFMRSICLWLLFSLFPITSSAAKVMLFQEPGFPTVDNEPVSLATLRSALGPDAQVVNLAALQNVAALENVDLLVLPYGSAVPVSAWAIAFHFQPHHSDRQS